MFLAPWFAVAGVVFAAGPIVIHLLNRRRHRTVHWAAMDFLREAVARTRRLWRLRDLVLLALRTLAILLLGLALARPYLNRPPQAAGSSQPVHAVLLIDNSLSMSYQQLDGTLLDRARQKARELIDDMPAGSRFTVLPICGGEAISTDPAPSREDALETLAGIELVDRQASPAAAVELAQEACRRGPEMPKRIVLLGDPPLVAYPPDSLAPALAALPSVIEAIEVAADEPANAWVADFRLQDAIGDLQTPAHFLATIAYQGSQPRRDVEATLVVDGAAIASVRIDLLPGQTREVRFPPYRFQVAAEAGRPAAVAAEVRLTPDSLPADDRRFLVVPVAASVPVVFVDQYGTDEDPRRNRFGETLALRRLLGAEGGGLLAARRLAIDGVTRDALADARLVVVAGVAAPGAAAPLLRQYVEQGGNLLLAAGGAFDPAAWAATWNAGGGVLPLPLAPALAGRSPDEGSGPLVPRQIDVASLVHDYFIIEQVAREELDDLYRLPYFFKTAILRADDAAIAEAQRQGEAADGLRWLAWQPSQWEAAATTDAATIQKPIEPATAYRPRVLASLVGGTPLVVQRRIGRGEVVFFASGFSPQWSTLATTNTMLVFDRICRDLLERTLPPRMMSTDDRRIVAVAAAERSARFVLTDPAGRERTLGVDALGADRWGVSVDRPPRRGHWRLMAHGAAGAGDEAKLWEATLAINGPADESDLRRPPAPPEPAAAMVGWAPKPRAGEITAAAEAFQHGIWKWLLLAMLLLLIAETFVMLLPALLAEQPPPARGDTA